jgi:hypothetical protein
MKMVRARGTTHIAGFVFVYNRLSQPCLPESRSDFSATLTAIAFDDSSLRWLEIST